MQVLTNVPEVTQTVELKASERMKKVHMSPPNLMWPKIFAEEKIILEKIFGDSIVYIEHIGSTARGKAPAGRKKGGLANTTMMVVLNEGIKKSSHAKSHSQKGSSLLTLILFL